MFKSLCLFAKLFPETSQETFGLLGAQILLFPARAGATFVLPLLYI